MLTKKDMMEINNRLQGTGTKQDEYLDMGYNTLKNSANKFLYDEAPIVETYAPVYAEEIKMERPSYDIDALVNSIVYKTYVKDIKEETCEGKIAKPEVIETTYCGDELEIPYFLTPFYSECKAIAIQQGTTVDAIAYEKLAKQLGISVRRAVRLVREGLIEIRM